MTLKQYKYIGQDPNKKWWIADKCESWFWDYIIKSITLTTSQWSSLYPELRIIRTLPKELIENEPTIREEIKENLLWNAMIEYMEIKDRKGWASLDDLEKCVKKHLGITREEIDKLRCRWSCSKNDAIKLFEDRWLLIDD
jgi:hypothetical protein